jgi:hypothetical protein
MRLIPLVTFLFLSACSSTHQALVTSPPTKYRAAIVQNVRENFKDPSSILDPTISEPFRGNDRGFDHWLVCIRVNAKNSYGGYAGLSYVVYGFSGETIVSNIDQNSLISVIGTCSGRTYSPFKELLQRPTSSS